MNNSELQICEQLENGGFKKAVAGKDFERIAKAFAKSQAEDLGILLTGVSGCGKTFAMQVAEAQTIITLDARISVLSESSVNWTQADDSSKYYRKALIDDLGAEEPYRNFGEVRELLGAYICKFHAHWSRERQEGRRDRRLYVTTNLSASQIHGRYGDRVITRLLEMCILVNIEGANKRKITKIN